MAATYDVGTKAWQPDVTEGWVASEVEQKNLDGDKVTLVFQLANGEVCPPQQLLVQKSRR
jgi:myosin-5